MTNTQFETITGIFIREMDSYKEWKKNRPAHHQKIKEKRKAKAEATTGGAE